MWAAFHGKKVKNFFLMVCLWERNTSSLHISLEPTDSLPAETHTFRTIIFIDPSTLLNRKHNSKITIFFGSCIFKIPKENFLKCSAQTIFIFGKYILKTDSLHPEEKLAVFGGRNGHFLLSHYCKTHRSKDFSNQQVNNL